jgi:hypothetical protein
LKEVSVRGRADRDGTNTGHADVSNAYVLLGSTNADAIEARRVAAMNVCDAIQHTWA